MINIEGTAYMVHYSGADYKATSSVPGYAVLDVVNFRQYRHESSCALAISSRRFARKNNQDYATCPLQIRGFSVTGARRLTRGGAYCYCMPALIHCLEHVDCCDSHENVFIYCEDHDVEKVRSLIEAIWIKVDKG